MKKFIKDRKIYKYYVDNINIFIKVFKDNIKLFSKDYYRYDNKNYYFNYKGLILLYMIFNKDKFIDIVSLFLKNFDYIDNNKFSKSIIDNNLINIINNMIGNVYYYKDYFYTWDTLKLKIMEDKCLYKELDDDDIKLINNNIVSYNRNIYTIKYMGYDNVYVIKNAFNN